jgi:putative transposase
MEVAMARFDLTDFEWPVISPPLPNKPRGVARVDDRRVLNGIFWRPRTGAPWADIPQRHGPRTVWDRLLEAVSMACDGDIQMIDSSSIRVRQHAANPSAGHSTKLRLAEPLASSAQEKTIDPVAWVARGAA